MRAAQTGSAWHQAQCCCLCLGVMPAHEQNPLQFMCIAESLILKISATNSCLFVDTELFKCGERSKVLLHVLVPLSNEIPLSRML